jgi:hypothetical protein
MHRIAAALLAAAPLFASAQEAPPVDGRTRVTGQVAGSPDAGPASGVHLGFGLGVGTIAQSTGGNGGGSALRIRIGAARSPRVAFGFEGALTSRGGVQLGSYDVGATFFPWGRFFHLRGAVGLTTLDVRFRSPERGANLLAGAGLWLGSVRGANLTVNLEGQYHRTSAGDRLFQNAAASAALWLGLEWR